MRRFLAITKTAAAAVICLTGAAVTPSAAAAEPYTSFPATAFRVAVQYNQLCLYAGPERWADEEGTGDVGLADCSATNPQQRWTYDRPTRTVRSVAYPDRCWRSMAFYIRLDQCSKATASPEWRFGTNWYGRDWAKVYRLPGGDWLNNECLTTNGHGRTDAYAVLTNASCNTTSTPARFSLYPVA
jgi:hypothetical protein